MTAVAAQPAATESSRTNGSSTKNAPVPGSAQCGPSTLRTVTCSTIRCHRKIRRNGQQGEGEAYSVPRGRRAVQHERDERQHETEVHLRGEAPGLRPVAHTARVHPQIHPVLDVLHGEQPHDAPAVAQALVVEHQERGDDEQPVRGHDPDQSVPVVVRRPRSPGVPSGLRRPTALLKPPGSVSF
ncbi:hypothetical protein ACFXKR_10210 [Streptomyces violascens]|uniref:hypothetical protein n=1 Tax=Streptomyces violascens TaxID=67381 RepID=UPI003696BE8A